MFVAMDRIKSKDKGRPPPFYRFEVDFFLLICIFIFAGSLIIICYSKELF